MTTPHDPPIDTTGLTDDERVALSAETTALAIKVGPARARGWARGRIAEILASREEPS